MLALRTAPQEPRLRPQACGGRRISDWGHKASGAALWQQLQVAPTEPRRGDDFNRRPSPPYGLREFDPVHRSRHVDVGKHNSDIVPAFQDTDGFVRVRRPERLKSGVANHVDREHKDKSLVLDREHDRSMGRFHHNTLSMLHATDRGGFRAAASFNVSVRRSIHPRLEIQ